MPDFFPEFTIRFAISCDLWTKPFLKFFMSDYDDIITVLTGSQPWKNSSCFGLILISIILEVNPNRIMSEKNLGNVIEKLPIFRLQPLFSARMSSLVRIELECKHDFALERFAHATIDKGTASPLHAEVGLVRYITP